MSLWENGSFTGRAIICTYPLCFYLFRFAWQPTGYYDLGRGDYGWNPIKNQCCDFYKKRMASYAQQCLWFHRNLKRDRNPVGARMGT